MEFETFMFREVEQMNGHGWLHSVGRRLRRQRLDQDHHLYTWNPTTLRNLLAAGGFRMQSFRAVTSPRQDPVAPVADISGLAFRVATWVLGVALSRKAAVAVPID